MIRAVVAILVLSTAACAELAPPAGPVAVDVPYDEPFRHGFTNVLFPARAGIFVREGVSRYDVAGFDTSGHYSSRMIGSVATVYIYPGTNAESLTMKELFDHYAQVKADVGRRTPGATIVSESRGTFSIGDGELSGLQAVYHLPRFNDVDVPIESHLYLFAVGQWYLKFRISFPIEARDEALAQIQPFLSAMWWER